MKDRARELQRLTVYGVGGGLGEVHQRVGLEGVDDWGEGRVARGVENVLVSRIAFEWLGAVFVAIRKVRRCIPTKSGLAIPGDVEHPGRVARQRPELGEVEDVVQLVVWGGGVQGEVQLPASSRSHRGLQNCDRLLE